MPHYIKWLVTLSVLLCLSGTGAVSIATELVPETRALWVVRGDLTSRSGIDYVFRFAKALGINSLFVQVTSGGSTLIHSNLLPRSAQVSPDFDPLEYIIEQARTENIEIHAWINAFVQSGFSSLPQDERYIVNSRPELVTYDVNGRSLLDMVSFFSDRIPSDLPGLMLEPTLPAVRELVAAHAAEVTSQYDVDGIHLDYIRYAGRNYGYNPESRAAFKQLHGHDPLDFAPHSATDFSNEHGLQLRVQLERAWDDYRRDAVTQTVVDVYNAVTEVKPWVVVSTATFANQADAYQHRFQDWTMWLREGLVDLVLPMAYAANPPLVRSQLEIAANAARVGDRHVLAGIGSYLIKDDRETFVSILEHARELGTQGFSLFSYQSIVGHLNTFIMIRDLFGEGDIPPVPAMPWKEPRPAIVQ